MTEESSFPTLKRFLVGKPIPSHLAHHERLSRLTGLAVLASDALSSVAYATDFIVATLVLARRAGARLCDPDERGTDGPDFALEFLNDFVVEITESPGCMDAVVNFSQGRF